MKNVARGKVSELSITYKKAHLTKTIFHFQDITLECFGRLKAFDVRLNSREKVKKYYFFDFY